jgi:signal transduction histidine kinase
MVLAMIEDDGKGFDPALREHGETSDRHLGLYGMKERALLLGGTLAVESAPGRGTTIVVRVPVADLA